MIGIISYALGLTGMWLFCDGYISIIIYHRWIKSKDGGNSWAFDHSIRLIRMAIGIGLMVAGWLLR